MCSKELKRPEEIRRMHHVMMPISLIVLDQKCIGVMGWEDPILPTGRRYEMSDTGQIVLRRILLPCGFLVVEVEEIFRDIFY